MVIHLRGDDDFSDQINHGNKRVMRLSGVYIMQLTEPGYHYEDGKRIAF